MAEGAYLVIDVGTGGIKSIAFDTQGHPIFKALSPIDFRFSGSSVGFDPRASWTEVCKMIRETVRFSAKKGKRILAVSSTSMREGNVFYDDRGVELLAVPNIDGRAGVEAREIAGKFGDLIYEKSGHWPMAMFLVCRLMWLKRHEPELFRRTARVSMINDWVLYRLSGRLFSEPTNGCETAAFDLRTRNWSDEIVKELGIDSSILPPVEECGTVLGKVNGKVSNSTGLDPSTDVVLGAADTEAALIGCGAFDPGSVAAVAGTTTPIQAVTATVENDPGRRTWSCCHAVPGRWIVESNAGATGLVFDWWSRIVQADYSTLDEEVAKTPPGSNGVTAMVGSSIFDARSMAAFSGVLSGISPWTDRGSISRALIEGACYAVRANLERVEEVVGTRFENMIFCGGGASSDIWTKIQADVLGRRVIRHRLGDATPRGAAVLCSIAAGQFSEIRRASSGFGERSSTVPPNRREATGYETRYHSWLEAIQARR